MTKEAFFYSALQLRNENNQKARFSSHRDILAVAFIRIFDKRDPLHHRMAAVNHVELSAISTNLCRHNCAHPIQSRFPQLVMHPRAHYHNSTSTRN